MNGLLTSHLSEALEQGIVEYDAAEDRPFTDDEFLDSVAVASLLVHIRRSTEEGQADVQSILATYLDHVTRSVSVLQDRLAAQPDLDVVAAIEGGALDAMHLHPFQPIYWDDNGLLRFSKNQAVRDLYTHGPFCSGGEAWNLSPHRADLVQFDQLIGFSVSGFGDRGHPSAVVAKADRLAEAFRQGDGTPAEFSRQEIVVDADGRNMFRENLIVRKMFDDPSRVTSLRDPGDYTTEELAQLAQLCGASPDILEGDEETVRRTLIRFICRRPGQPAVD